MPVGDAHGNLNKNSHCLQNRNSRHKFLIKHVDISNDNGHQKSKKKVSSRVPFQYTDLVLPV